MFCLFYVKINFIGERGDFMNRYLLEKKLTVGRNPSCDIVLPLPTVSGVHCRFDIKNDSVFVQDLYSKNGTFVNKKKIEKCQVFPGDLIDLGGVKIQIEFENDKCFVIVKTVASFIPSFNQQLKGKTAVSDFLKKIKQEINCDAIYLFERQNKSVVLKELLAYNDAPPPSRTIIKHFLLSKKNKDSLWAIKDIPVKSESITNFHIYSILLSQFSVTDNIDLWFYCYWETGCKEPEKSEFTLRNLFLDFYKSLKEYLEEETMNIKSKIDEKEWESTGIKYEMLGKSPEFIKAKELAIKAASSDFPVLLIGESGTGKELFARFIHNNSSRKDKKFIVVNCPAIPGSLAESELFGHKKGAFTNALQDRVGKLKLADGGTLFLDQVESLSINVQSKLLRFMQEREFERVGDNTIYHSDVRLIAATNENPDILISLGKMRPDFYFRIAYLPITLPNLSERKDDIPLLCEFFLKKHRDKLNGKIKGFSKKALDFLAVNNLPGNIRELENLVCRCATFVDSDIIDEKDLRHFLTPNHKNDYQIVSSLLNKPYKEAKEGFESIYIEKLLEKTDRNITKAAKISGLARKTVYQLMKKFSK